MSFDMIHTQAFSELMALCLRNPKVRLKLERPMRIYVQGWVEEGMQFMTQVC